MPWVIIGPALPGCRAFLSRAKVIENIVRRFNANRQPDGLIGNARVLPTGTEEPVSPLVVFFFSEITGFSGIWAGPSGGRSMGDPFSGYGTQEVVLVSL